MNSYRQHKRGNDAFTFLAVIAVFLFTVILFICVFCWYGRAYARVSLNKTYYFLVRDCEDTTASAIAGQVYFLGGAGYLLEYNGEHAVVLACYFKQTDAEYVLQVIADKGVETRILILKTEDFSLGGRKAAQKSKITANIETTDTSAEILYETANDLERADISQEQARAAVRSVVTSLRGLRTENTESMFQSWNLALSSAEKRGTEISEGILFAKDLRYMQTQLCMMIVKAKDYFV